MMSAHAPVADKIVAAEFHQVVVFSLLTDPSRVVMVLKVGEGELVNVSIAPIDLMGMASYLYACGKKAMSVDDGQAPEPPAAERPN